VVKGRLKEGVVLVQPEGPGHFGNGFSQKRFRGCFSLPWGAVDMPAGRMMVD
jgi:hypothetical protein